MNRDDRTRRRHLAVGTILFVLGVGIAAYLGYTERYVGEPQLDVVNLVAWGLVIGGLVLFPLGLLQAPMHR
jgi:general stress protein CsbA